MTFIQPIVLLILASFTSVRVSIGEDKVDQLLGKWRFNRPTPQDLQIISVAEKEAIIQRLHPLAHSDQRLDRLFGREILVGLGDSTTIKSVVADFRGRDDKGGGLRQSLDAQYILQDALQPLVIPMIAPDLFIDEPAEWVPLEDRIIHPKSTTSAIVITHILEHALPFRPEVREWARRLVPTPESAFREQMRRWWEQNKEHFEREDYAAVTPLDTNGEPKLAPQTSNPTGQGPHPAPVPPSGNTTPSPAPSSSPPPANWPLKLAILAVIVGVIGVSVAIRARSKQSRNEK